MLMLKKEEKKMVKNQIFISVEQKRVPSGKLCGGFQLGVAAD